METSASLASGSGGKPLGTERLSAFPTFLPRPSGSDGGRLFAEEVERAVTRSRGEGLEAQRLDDLTAARRSERRSTFAGPERELAPEPERIPSEAASVAISSSPLTPSAAPAPPPVAGLGSSEGPNAAPPSPEGATRSEGTPGASVPTAGIPGTLPLPSSPVASASSPTEAATARVQARPEPLPLAQGEAARAPTRLAKSPRVAEPPASNAAVAQERVEAILRQIELHARGGVQRLTLELEPAELGRLSVQLALRAGRVTAIVRGESPETLALLAEHEEGLTQLFARRGVQADEVRFELGFRAPGRTPPRAPTRATPPFPGPQGSGAPSLDTYA